MNAGVGPALNEVARLYDIGEGVERNPKYAVEVYTRAIEEEGSTLAMYNLGVLLAKGAEGVPVNPKRAVELFLRAIEEDGCIDSMQHLGFLLSSKARRCTKRRFHMPSVCSNALSRRVETIAPNAT